VSLEPSLPSSFWRLVSGAVSAAGRAINTTSKVIPGPAEIEPSPWRASRAASRSRLLARFLATAPLIWRLALTPIRVVEPRPGVAKPTRLSPE